MKIFVVGSGKLATAILTSDLSFQNCEILKWETHFQTLDEKAIIVHAGSGRQLIECFKFCESTGSVLIELSTGFETEKMNPHFPLVICPNISILVLKTLFMLKVSGRHFENYSISITESHQSAKTTEAGTAFSFADSLKFPPENIVSIRDPEIQRTEIGIPLEYINKHAYHKIVIHDGIDEVTIETKVLGHDSYTKGVKMIVEMLLKFRLENKKYTVFDLIDTDLL